MGKHLKTQVIEGLKSAGFVFEALPKGPAVFFDVTESYLMKSIVHCEL